MTAVPLAAGAAGALSMLVLIRARNGPGGGLSPFQWLCTVNFILFLGVFGVGLSLL